MVGIFKSFMNQVKKKLNSYVCVVTYFCFDQAIMPHVYFPRLQDIYEREKSLTNFLKEVFI